tara:strand:- start:306 stop:542 length:237 start_codon:yes stop_codon:yes gene_type:complete
MRINYKGIIIVFFIIYIFAYALSSCSAVKADEPKITCEAFIKEDICNMTPEEQEIWFLELLKKILEDTIDKKKTGIEI